MADARGIRRIVALLLDRAQAKRTEEETQASLRRATDMDRPTAEMDRYAKNARADLATVGKAADGVRGKFAGMLGAIGFAAAGAVLARFVARMWELGSAAAETQSKFNTTFGREGAAQVQGFIDQFGTVLGLNRTMAQELTATAGAIVQGMGASQDASAEFSERIIRLAGDLQSFHNVPIADTFAAIKSGLVGEFDPMDRFGIVIRQADINLRALTETGKANEKQLTNLEKANAALNLMVERAGPALGDLERTMASDANQARNLAAEFENLQIELATKLMPVFGNVIDQTNENKEGLKGLAYGAGVVARVVGGVLWAAFNSVASLLAGQAAVAWHGAIVAAKLLTVSIGGLVLAKEQLQRAFGLGSDDGVARAAANLHTYRVELEAARRELSAAQRVALRPLMGGVGRDFAAVWNLGNAAEGEFEWESAEAKAAREAEVERRRRAAEAAAAAAAARSKKTRDALKDEADLLGKVGEARALTGDELNRLTAIEAQLTAALERRNLSLAEELRLRELLTRVRGTGDAQRARVTPDVAMVSSSGAAAQPINLGVGRTNASLQEDRQRVESLLQQAEALSGIARWRKLTADEAAAARDIDMQITAELGKQNLATETALGLMQLQTEIRDVIATDTAVNVENAFALMERASDQAGQNIADRWGDTFQMLFEGALNLSGLLGSIWDGYTKGMAGALAGEAKLMAGKAGVKAIGALADALAALGAHKPDAAAKFFAASGKYLAEAAGWAALGGGAAAFAASGGGGGGLGGGGSRDTGVGIASQAQPLPPEVHLTASFNPLDPRDTKVQAVVYDAYGLGTERMGRDARVVIHPPSPV